MASALILYEAQRQRQAAGMYNRTESALTAEEQQILLFEGGYPVLAEVSRRKGLPRPYINAIVVKLKHRTHGAEMQMTQNNLGNLNWTE